MVAAFPHMGNAYMLAKALLDDMGVPYVVPPFTSRRTLELGARHTPESACLPLKITAGNLMEAREMGADTIVMLGAWGPCRFGYYCQMQQEILREAGQPMRAVILEACSEGIRETCRRVSRLFGGFPVLKILRAIRDLAVLSEAVDRTERLYRAVKTRELSRGRADGIYHCFRRKALSTSGSAQMRALADKTGEALRSVPVDEGAEPLRIGIVGEIYGIIDPYTNLELESRICALGAYAERSLTLSDWIVGHMIRKQLRLPRDLRFADAARPYLGTDIGGHTRETLGHTALFAREGCDGVIQVYPLGCMPEIVAQSILPRVSADCRIPVLTLVIDEMTGEAGYMTRVEAFLDLLATRRKLKRPRPSGEGDARCR